MTPILLVGCAVLLVILLIVKFLRPPHDPQEPPLVPPSIPIIGHVIGLLRDGSGYYSKVAKECQKPIFSLGLPNSKLYVVTSPRLVAACDRRAKIISFAPYVVEFGRRILHGTPEAVDLLAEDMLEETGHAVLRTETMKAMHEALKPGPTLDKTAGAIVKSVLDSLLSDDLVNASGDYTANGVPLFGWLRNLVSVATTNGIYGVEHNPFQDPKVLDGFWTVDQNFTLLLLNKYPEVIAPSGSKGRKQFFQGFQKYYSTKGVLETGASDLIKARYKANKKFGVSEADIARFDLGVCTALLVNTIPAIGWTLCHVYSKPDLLAELRRGIEGVVFPGNTKQKAMSDTTGTVTVNIAQVARGFPLLDSLIREVLRVQSNNASARAVLKDTLISDGTSTSTSTDSESSRTYLLKKGTMLVMPSAPIHADTKVWGPTAGEFDPYRFLKLEKEKKKVSSSAWRTFGGGNALCPGRHLAIQEITSILIVMVLRYDFMPGGAGSPGKKDGKVGGEWKIPETRNHLSTSILTPAEDIRVCIAPRKDLEHVSWEFVWEPEGRTTDGKGETD